VGFLYCYFCARLIRRKTWSVTVTTLHDEPLARRSRRTDSDDSNVLGFLALAARGHVELDLLTLVQGLVTRSLNVRVVNEHVVTLLAEIKPKPFSALKNFTVPVANALSLSDRRPQTLRNAPKRLQPTGVAMCPKPNPAPRGRELAGLGPVRPGSPGALGAG